jgi:hypothetical protein
MFALKLLAAWLILNALAVLALDLATYVEREK